MFTKFPHFYELLLQWVWKNDLSYCLHSTQVLIWWHLRSSWSVVQLLPATSACWNLHLKLEEHCNDCQEWLTLVIFLHKRHSSDSPKHTFHGQNVINTHSRPKDVGMIRKANENKQIFWSCYSERSEALKIYLDSLIFLFTYHCFASKLVSNRAVIPTENPTQTLPQPLPINPNAFKPVMGQR